ncbi:aminomethyl transferase family protein [Halonotius terrestris]|uniref:Aminomethyl transferase family protein n=1 Tax=Halonotius terrestris TaxID=2487750 RepID=A0A8J8TDV0_9EURY|nr:glycine cleavage T C-terminal barrel domain-containing protein [Halonotius terrestris]TQQ83544.1 aminomethyl transferase family protein [Halonotius terrestris]
MTLLGAHHDDLGAELIDRAGRSAVDHYGRPAVAHRAVRNGVGVIEMGYGIVAVTGSERVEYVDNIVTNRVPATDGEGCYAFVLDPQGRIETDCYIYNADEQLLLFTPPSQVEELVADWSEKIFVQDVEISDVSADFGVFGVHGPSATEKIASVLNHAGAPEPELHFDRGSMGDAGVTVVASDNPTGEDGYTVICGADDAPGVFDTLLNHGLNAAPFGYRTWDTLTLEAGTPRFESELQGEIPNTVGARHALDFDKGCYIGQEVVSKVENRGRPSKQLVGLKPESSVAAGDSILVDGDDVGRITRAADSPSLDAPIALGFVSTDVVAADDDAEPGDIVIDTDESDSPVAADRAALPFVAGSADSLRLPQY